MNKTITKAFAPIRARKKTILWTAALLLAWFVGYTWFYRPVTLGRETYKAYLSEKFTTEPTIASEKWHYEFASFRHIPITQVIWDIDAGIHGTYHFCTIQYLLYETDNPKTEFDLHKYKKKRHHSTDF